MWHRLADVLFPPVCTLCRDRLPGAPEPVCARCRVSLESLACRAPLPLGAHARAAFRYEGTARQALLCFKYHDRHRLGPWLSARMAEAVPQDRPWTEIDLVTAVPLHWLKRRLRGADPVGSLGRSVAARLGKPWRPAALTRRRWTTTQTRLTPAQRQRNVARAFRARPHDVSGRSVLLIDDILTTGATSQACAHALRQAGAARVLVLTAAATPGA